MKNQLISRADKERAVSLLTFINGLGLEKMAAQEDCSVDDVEEVIENRFQSLAWNLGIEAEELVKIAVDFDDEQQIVENGI